MALSRVSGSVLGCDRGRLEDVAEIALALPASTEGALAICVSGACGTSCSSGSGRCAARISRHSDPTRRGDRVEHLGTNGSLLADGLGVFFTTPHFHGSAAILVRLERITPGDLEDVVVDAWLGRAPPPRLIEAYLAGRER
ncbi:MAG: hypothetical protein NVSMB51_08210 [Solirubrobacteraceae bacterium]